MFVGSGHGTRKISQQCSTKISRLFHELAGKIPDINELRALSEDERRRVADEPGLTTAELENLVAAGPQASVEIQRMMRRRASI